MWPPGGCPRRAWGRSARRPRPGTGRSPGRAPPVSGAHDVAVDGMGQVDAETSAVQVAGEQVAALEPLGERRVGQAANSSGPSGSP